MERQFLDLGEVAGVLGVSLKKVRASLDTRSGLIELGGSVPCLETVKMGRLRMVHRAVLERWLTTVAGQAALVDSAAPTVPKSGPRRRGRPRRALAAGGEQ